MLGRIEGEIAKIDQIGLVAAVELAVEGLARLDQRILVAFGAGGQHRLAAVERKCRKPVAGDNGTAERGREHPNASVCHFGEVSSGAGSACHASAILSTSFADL